MYKQVLDPVGDSLLYSMLFAIVPIVALFILLGGLRLARTVAALIGLAVAILVAIIVYGMPSGRRSTPAPRARPSGSSRSSGSSSTRSGSTR